MRLNFRREEPKVKLKFKTGWWQLTLKVFEISTILTFGVRVFIEGKQTDSIDVVAQLLLLF